MKIFLIKQTNMAEIGEQLWSNLAGVLTKCIHLMRSSGYLSSGYLRRRYGRKFKVF